MPHHVSFSEAAAPLPGPQVVSLLLSSSFKLSGHVCLKVMGIWLLCPTSSGLLLESQVGLVSLSFLSTRGFPGPKPLQPKVAFSFPVPGPRAEWLTGKEIYGRRRGMKKASV